MYDIRKPHIMTIIVFVMIGISAGFLFLLEITGKFFDLGLRNNGQGMQFETAIALVMLMAALALALHRRSQVVKLQAKLVDQQAMELGFQEEAMNVHGIVSISDPDARITRVNDNFLRVFGYERHEVIGQKASLIYYGKDDDQRFIEVTAKVQAGNAWTGEHKARTKTGEVLFMQCTILPMLDENGRHIKNVSLRTDVTAARKADADRFLKAMLDDLQDEVYIYDVETLAMDYANDSARRRCDWAVDEVKSKSIVDTGEGFHVGIFRHHVAPLFTGEQQSVVVELPHQKGPVEISTKLYESEDGRMLFLSVLRDITERKRLEMAKLETVAVVSHELRTPLTSIKGSIRLLKSGALGEMSESAAKVLDIADRNSERLLTVVNDILDLEKIRAGKLKFKRSPVDLTALVNEAVEINKGYGDEHKVGFASDAGQVEAIVEGNQDRLMQVMANLMSNAAKFSAEGDTVTVSLQEHDLCWRVAVSDNGPGIPEEVGQSIFDSFTQAEASDGIARKGTGLGLTISKKIVEHHGGRIGYTSKIGQGTTFYFELPKALAAKDQDRINAKKIAAE